HPITLKNMTINPINSTAFIQSMATSEGVLCGAGFETPAEALYLNKKLLVIPMKNQYEQHLNAAALEEMGVPVINSLKRKFEFDIELWLNNADHVQVDYQDNTFDIVENIVKRYTS